MEFVINVCSHASSLKFAPYSKSVPVEFTVTILPLSAVDGLASSGFAVVKVRAEEICFAVIIDDAPDALFASMSKVMDCASPALRARSHTATPYKLSFSNLTFPGAPFVFHGPPPIRIACVDVLPV